MPIQYYTNSLQYTYHISYREEELDNPSISLSISFFVFMFKMMHEKTIVYNIHIFINISINILDIYIKLSYNLSLYKIF